MITAIFLNGRQLREGEWYKAVFSKHGFRFHTFQPLALDIGDSCRFGLVTEAGRECFDASLTDAEHDFDFSRDEYIDTFARLRDCEPSDFREGF